jgi:hypothetical protein
MIHVRLEPNGFFPDRYRNDINGDFRVLTFPSSAILHFEEVFPNEKQ